MGTWIVVEWHNEIWSSLKNEQDLVLQRNYMENPERGKVSCGRLHILWYCFYKEKHEMKQCYMVFMNTSAFSETVTKCRNNYFWTKVTFGEGGKEWYKETKGLSVLSVMFYFLSGTVHY